MLIKVCGRFVMLAVGTLTIHKRIKSHSLGFDSTKRGSSEKKKRDGSSKKKIPMKTDKMTYFMKR